jgi:hypothetical protein
MLPQARFPGCGEISIKLRFPRITRHQTASYSSTNGSFCTSAGDLSTRTPQSSQCNVTEIMTVAMETGSRSQRTSMACTACRQVKVLDDDASLQAALWTFTYSHDYSELTITPSSDATPRDVPQLHARDASASRDHACLTRPSSDERSEGMHKS